VQIVRALYSLGSSAGKLVRMETPRLLFIHAHPDDETLTTGATIAHYATLGAQVRVVTCTLGEEGEVIGERWAQLAVDQADQLGGFRIGELTTALDALGIDEPIFLGGPGRWRDSGMEGTPPRHRQRFIDADPREAVGALVAIIREMRPHVVVTYDAKGGYGHPDHIHAHEVTMAAVAASGSADYPGESWTVPKVYWTVMSTTAMGAGLEALQDVPREWIRVSLDDVPFGYSDDAIDAVMDVAEQLPAKVAALRAHATQVTVAPDGRSCALSNDFALPIGAIEHYVLASGTPGDRDDRGWETDLLAGLNLE
jgi:N-acetyl-1-D-myo-inositol-2-amino-2-deoxy-alpha-D-glucopyranoside deacetylase